MKQNHDLGVEIHAKVLISRFGKRALEDAQSHAKKLRKKGDNEGYQIWMRVADMIKKMRQSDKKK